MIYSIYRLGDKILDIEANGTHTCSVMAEDVVDMNFILESYVDFKQGDWVQVFGRPYYLNLPVEPTKISTREYRYTMQFEAEFYDLAKVRFRNLDENNQLTVPKFTIMGDANTIIDLVVMNMARFGIGWVKGSVAETETFLFQFDKENCLNALVKLAQQFELEFWFAGKQINFNNRIIPTTLEFKYGKGNGLKQIVRRRNQDVEYFNRLYVYGGTRNLPLGYRGGSEYLLMPSSTGAYLEDIDDLVITNKAKESEVYFEEVFPKRDGTITSVDVDDILVFSDSSMDFDVNDYLVEGKTAKVTFIDGRLAGYELELTDYDHATKTFTLKLNEDDSNITIPNETFKPGVGDKYYLFDITMPETYISAAESLLQTKATTHFSKSAQPGNKYLYDIMCDPLHLKRNNITPTINEQVRIIDAEMGIDQNIRINKTVRDIQFTWQYQLEIKNVPTLSTTGRDYVARKDIEYTVEQIKPLKPKNYWSLKNLYNRVRDLISSVFDPDGYFDSTKIRPNSIETLALAVGTKSQNFALEEVVFKANFNNNANAFSATAGNLVHFSINIPLGNVWLMSPYVITSLDPAKLYYLYARCSKTSLVGTWVLTDAQITVEQETGYFHFLVGTLYKVNADGYRDFDITKGMAYLVGETLTAGRIKDASGDNYWDLNTGELVNENVTLRGHIDAESGSFENVTMDSSDIGGFHVEDNIISSNTPGWGVRAFELDAALSVFRFYSGNITSDNTSGGTILPDISLSITTGSDGGSVGEMAFAGRLVDANRDATRISGNGVLSNSSNTSFLDIPAESNASVVGILRRGNSQNLGTGPNGRGVSAAVAGISQAPMGNYASKTYGGFFTNAFIGGLFAGAWLKNTNTNETIPHNVTTVMLYSGSGGVTLFFPNREVEEGRIIIFKNGSGSNITASRSGTVETLLLRDFTSATSTLIPHRGFSIWQRLNNRWSELFSIIVDPV